ncbi:MAG: AEC family transporter [Pseudomonadota bacterium]
MSLLVELLQVVLPVFLIIGAGYTALKTRFVSDAVIDPLVAYTIKAAVPCLLFMAMVRTDLGVAINPWVLSGFFVSATIVFFTAMSLARRIWKRRPGEAVTVGFAAFFPNAVMMGIPITERAFGGVALDAIFGIIAFHSMYNYFLGFVTMEAVRRDSETVLAGLRKAFMTTFTNPLMVGLMLGMAVNLAEIPLPGIAADALDMLAASAIPAALFALGGVLTRYRLADQIGEALMVSTLALVLQPALAWIVTGPILGLPLPFIQAAVIMSAMPTGINSYIFASIYNRGVATAASAVLLGTALSAITITGWLAFLEWLAKG